MPKYTRYERVKRLDKLTRSQQEDILKDLLFAFGIIQNSEDVALFITDLFTQGEIKILAKRLRIAKLLSIDTTYDEISREIHVSHATIAKIAIWLSERGEGFRRVLMKLPLPETESYSEVEALWKRFQRRYPRYFWPQLLGDELEKTMEEGKKKQLHNILEALEDKRELHKEIEENYHRTRKSHK